MCRRVRGRGRGGISLMPDSLQRGRVKREMNLVCTAFLELSMHLS